MRDVGPADRAQANARPTVPAGAGQPATPAPAAGAVPAPSPAPPPAVQLAPTLARLLESGAIAAVVVGRDVQGQPVVQAGTQVFVLSGGPPLADQARLLLQLLNAGAAAQARILEVDGQPLQPPPDVTLELLPNVSGTAASPVRQAVAALESKVLARLGLTPMPADAAPPAGAAAAKAAPSLTAPPAPVMGKTVAGLAAPPAMDLATLVGKTILAVVTGAPHGPVTGATVAPALPWLRPAMAPNGATVVLTLRAIGEESAPLLASNQGARAPGAGSLPAAGQTILGRVGSQAGGGQTLLHTPFATLKADALAALPPGAAVAAEVIEWRLPTVVASAEIAEPAVAALMRLRRDWPAMRDALAVLERAAPDLAQAWAARLAPRADTRMASTLLRFMSALKEAQLDSWLDDAAQKAIEGQGRGDLVRRLRDDFRQMAELADQRAEGDWRAVLLPLADGREVRMAAFYVRRRRRRDGERDPGTRFILDLDLDRTGPLQFDGLVRPQQLDLMVRSARPLPAAWERDIAAIFEQSMAITGYRGKVAFQAGAASLVSPADDLRRAAPAAAVTV
jgi:hypothetical protein